MGGGAILLVAMAAVAACLLLGLGLFAFSRFVGHGSHQSVPCCYRASEQADWIPGFLRYDHDRLDHHGPGGLSMRVQHTWERARLDLGMARPVAPGEGPALPGGRPAIQVSCCYGTKTFDLVLAEENYTALRAWLESVPPGWNVNVA